MIIKGVLIALSVSILSCSQNSGGNLGYSQLASGGDPNFYSQNSGNAFPSGPENLPSQGLEGQEMGGVDTSVSTDVSTEPEVDPKPIGRKVYTDTELLQLFKDNSGLIETAIEESNPPGISDDEDTAKHYCSELRYDKFKIVTGGQSYSKPAERLIIKWDAGESAFKVLPASDAGNSIIYKLECSND